MIQQRSSSSLSCRRPLWAVLAWAEMSMLWCCPPTFPLLTMVLPSLQGALKYGFGEAIVACDMSKPCKFLSPESCQKTFLWTHKGVDLAPNPVICLVLQVGDAEKFRHLVSKAWILFSESASRVHWRWGLQSLNLLVKLMVLHRQILFCLAIAAMAETILMPTSAEQVPSLHRVAPGYLKLVASSNFWL